MGIEIRRSVVSEKEGGTALLFAVLEYPHFADCGKYFDEYYISMRDAVESWLRETELPRIKAEFAAAGEYERKFRFPRYDYRLKSRAQTEGDAVEIICDFDYSRGGVPIKHSSFSRRWSTVDGYMIPPKHRTGTNKNKKATAGQG
ncbi:MAG: hypothetical protein IJY27_03085 [Clostridia bacterium]|nr:hypothetical protein [Clostridia bacterium]